MSNQARYDKAAAELATLVDKLRRVNAKRKMDKDNQEKSIMEVEAACEAVKQAIVLMGVEA